MYCNMLQEKQIKYFTKAALSVCFIFLCQISQAGGDPFKKVSSGDTLKSPTLGAQLDKDEAIKCTRAELSAIVPSISNITQSIIISSGEIHYFPHFPLRRTIIIIA